VDHDLQATGKILPVTPGGLAQAAFHAIARYCFAQRPRHG
jgi:hypothetical protein